VWKERVEALWQEGWWPPLAALVARSRGGLSEMLQGWARQPRAAAARVLAPHHRA